MRKLNIKGIVIATAFSIILTSCQNKEEVKVNNETYNSTIIEEQQSIPETPSIIEESPINEKQEENTHSSNQESVPEEFNFFKDAKKEITSYIESEEFEALKEKGKHYVTTGIDFIFFDEPINGIYFSQLTEELKTDIIKEVKALDEAIMAYYPDYKESLSSKYQIASEFVSEKYLDVMDSIKEYLGEENYNAVGEIKDQIQEDVGNKKDEIVEDIKELYKTWKNN